MRCVYVCGHMQCDADRTILFIILYRYWLIGLCVCVCYLFVCNYLVLCHEESTNDFNFKNYFQF